MRRNIFNAQKKNYNKEDEKFGLSAAALNNNDVDDDDDDDFHKEFFLNSRDETSIFICLLHFILHSHSFIQIQI